MTDHIVRKLDFTGKALAESGWMVDRGRGSLVRLGRRSRKPRASWDRKPNPKHRRHVAGHAATPGRDLRMVVKISKADDGGYKAVFYSIDQGGDGIPVNKITLDGTTVKMTLTMIGGSYEGKLSSDGKTITGNWTQGPVPFRLI